MSSMFAQSRLAKELEDLKRNPVEGFSAGLADDGNLFQWDILVSGPPDTDYEGGLFRATMTFPPDFPNSPPKLKFQPRCLWHPNIYWETGDVCISILHPPVQDESGYEHVNERWNPIQSVSSILLSVISMLSSPNDSSPANVDAAVEWRTNQELFRKNVKRCVRKAQEMLF